MLSDFTGADKVYIACGYTDLRKGIDGLATLVQQHFHLDPHQYAVSVLRTAAEPDEGAVLGEGRVHSALQASGAGRIPMAKERAGSASTDAVAVSLAHGGAEN